MKGLSKDLREYSYAPLKERMINLGHFDNAQYNEYFLELMKFMDIARDNPNKEIAMVNEDVDEIWHNFIIHTKEYKRFNDKYMKSFMHHEPAETHQIQDRTPIDNFINGYKAKFGTMPNPKVWGDMNKVKQICSKCNMIEERVLH